MRAAFAWVCVLMAALVLAPGCGGGDGNTMPALCLTFSPAQTPGTGRVVARAAAGGSCANQVLEIVVTDVDNVFTGSFTVNFDPTKVVLGTVTSTGSFLAAGGVQVNVVQSNPQPGSVTIGISRVGASTGVDASGSQVLVRLPFAPLGTGTSTVTLTQAQLLGSQTPPQPKPGLTWAGGTFQVQ